MKLKINQQIACGLPLRHADLLRNWVSNHWQLHTYKLAIEDGQRDTEFLYDIYIDNGKTITNGQQMFLNGLIAGLKLCLT